MWNFRERNKSSSSRWLFGEPPAAFSELQLDYTILELQCTSITTSCRQLSCKGLWPTQCRELQRQEPAHQEGWVASISGCAMVVRFIVCFPRPRSSGKTAAILTFVNKKKMCQITAISFMTGNEPGEMETCSFAWQMLVQFTKRFWCTPSRFLLEETARLLQMPIKYAPSPNGNTWLVLSYTFWFPFSMCLLTPNTIRASVCRYVPLSPTC